MSPEVVHNLMDADADVALLLFIAVHVQIPLDRKARDSLMNSALPQQLSMHVVLKCPTAFLANRPPLQLTNKLPPLHVKESFADETDDQICHTCCYPGGCLVVSWELCGLVLDTLFYQQFVIDMCINNLEKVF